jgi:hypothetical protein
MNRKRSMHMTEEECIQISGGGTIRKETATKTYT